MIYLYTEDGKSGYEFWKFICDNIFPGTIEVKNLGIHSNCTELCKFVCKLTDRDNTYLIAYDVSFDNQQIMEEYQEMVEYIQTNNYDNVILLDFISLEYILLSFEKLVSWCFQKDDFLLEKRKEYLDCREDFLSLGDPICYESLGSIQDFIGNNKVKNVEQFCSKLLYYITRNTGFVVDKGILGECWYVNCCNYSSKADNDMCGLDHFLPTAKFKATQIFYNSCLYKRFKELQLITEVVAEIPSLFEELFQKH